MLYSRVMPHIHDKPGQHDHTVSAYIIRIDGDEPKILLHRHKKLGVFMQFGGHIELNETPWQAIKHEILEEAGYDFDQLELLQPKERLKTISQSTLHPQPFVHSTHKITDDHFHTDLGYAFVTKLDPNHAISSGESKDLRLFTLEELKALPAKDMFQDNRDRCEFAMMTCAPNWERVSPNTYDS